MMLLNRKALFLPATFGLWLTFASDLSAVATPAHLPPAPRKQPSVTSIGDVTIISVGIRTNLRRSDSFVFTGPNVVIESRDKTKPTQFRLLADEVSGKQTVNKDNGTVDITGHIRYTITQKTKEGTRTIQGTAGHAIYDQTTKRILLTAGVQASMTEAARLDGPATLISSTATIFTDRSQRYELGGDPAINDIKFTPRRNGKVKGKEEAQPIAGTPVHLHNFRSGEIEQGHNIKVDGPETTVDFSDPVENSVGNLVASHIAADFDTELTRAEANGDVRFRYERPGKKEGRQSLQGHSDTATYVADQHRLTVAGNVEADVVDSASLLEPAHLTASRIVEHTEAAGKNDKRQEPRVIYDVSGTPERSSLVFRPRPPEPKQATNQIGSPLAGAPGAPAAKTPPRTDALQSFTLGTVRVTGFDQGTFEPGRNAVLIGDRTVVHTEDKQARTSSTLRASRLTAQFAEDRTLQQMVAVGNVRFELQQPMEAKKTEEKEEKKTEAGKPQAAPRLAMFNATTTQATLTNTAQGQILTAPGPWRTRQTTDDPNRDLATYGEKGDTMTFNQATGDIIGDSGNKPGTIVMESIIVNKQAAETKKPGTHAPTKPAKNRKH